MRKKRRAGATIEPARRPRVAIGSGWSSEAKRESDLPLYYDKGRDVPHKIRRLARRFIEWRDG
ncbi:hypothetical protein [Bradyrhizobium sp. RT11b]|uniref:hypothetical protein n=1 Tax=Bradyrhizobium sp. RT11b TaxID=3156332 RepID=UPI00339B5CE3